MADVGRPKGMLHSEEVRARIQVGLLVNRLQSNGLGEITMTPSQVDSAKFLINKALPNLPERSEVDLTGNVSLNWPIPKTKLDQ